MRQLSTFTFPKSSIINVYILMHQAVLPIPCLFIVDYHLSMSVHCSDVVHIVTDQQQTGMPRFRAEVESCAHSEYCVQNPPAPFVSVGDGIP